MSTSGTVPAVEVVDTDRYPLTDPDDPAWHAVVARTRDELAEFGCCVLPDFIRPSLRETLERECAKIAPLAHTTVERVNAYNIAVDTPLPEGHPGRMVIGIDPPPAHAHCVEAWLENLVDVVAVSALVSPTRCTPRTRRAAPLRAPRR